MILASIVLMRRLLSDLWHCLLTRLGIRKPYREPGIGRAFMLRVMEQRLEELENRRHWPR